MALASVSTTEDGVPDGGATLIESCFCDPALRNWAGMCGTSSMAPKTRAKATPITPQRLRRLWRAAVRGDVYILWTSESWCSTPSSGLSLMRSMNKLAMTGTTVKAVLTDSVLRLGRRDSAVNLLHAVEVRA